ncbi:interferon-induced protein 44-like isoform X1 [Triplophysa rosa]|uniref:Interferon-induced protein 44-like n=1 Tax=Triplophysa rosa TaxID=992332 RepID=A0A9W7WYV4_TRIRA|nr:interferon-induced protein 44-like isoform X1 [Triplophysa rosa]XP_057188442.1 interferon-induced protein 44-like isoform X1 [Triplophysa rosa]XP_057188443.1 interferon-induced protein 44-like isoform X1 [Triplophysa rosa]XP_057188444.1 interferon-induced protein 44-like isoform X1 [Triplophysa rosa]XP_057188445.1 interferon-induced protein 44-like isoform X1 [Triplophysa rosa]XP_057188446.1 interferon-induced protein 44-like isoform X1 [Triplophysa rosa]XP_057188447.1 interferon-induced p
MMMILIIIVIAVLEFGTPWRDFDFGQKAVLLKRLKEFTLSNPDINHIGILVAGQIGAGKSSFINSVTNVFEGRITNRAQVNSSATDHSFTEIYNTYCIRSGGAILPFVFRDIMGLEPENFKGSSTEDIVNVVLGHIKDKYKFDPKDPLSVEKEHFNISPTLAEKALCLVYIIDANTVDFTDDKLIEKLRAIRLKLREKGIPQMIVMTKVDETCPLVKKDLKKVYSSAKIYAKMQMCSDKVGVPMTSIFPVKNYHEEIDTNDTIDVLILKALDQIVHNADDLLRDGAI